MAAAVWLQGQASATPAHRQAPNTASCKGRTYGDLAITITTKLQFQTHKSVPSPPERWHLCSDYI